MELRGIPPRLRFHNGLLRAAAAVVRGVWEGRLTTMRGGAICFAYSFKYFFIFVGGFERWEWQTAEEFRGIHLFPGTNEMKDLSFSQLV